MAGKTTKRQQYEQFRQENGPWSASKRKRLCLHVAIIKMIWKKKNILKNWRIN